MFIANCTRSNYALNVRLPAGGLIRLEIPSGTQKKFPKELSAGELDAVLKQITRYGARPRKDVRGKLSGFDGLVYSMDKPLSEDEIVSANEDQLDNAQNRSVRQATVSALASDLSNREGNKPKGKRKAKSVSISVAKRDGERGSEEPMMDIEITDSAGSSAKLPV